MNERENEQEQQNEIPFTQQPEDPIEILEWLTNNVARSDEIIEEDPTKPKKTVPPHEESTCAKSGEEPSDPIWTATWDVLKKNYASGHGPLADHVRCKFTVASPDGCRVSWFRGNFDVADLGIGGKWATKKITRQKVREPNPECPEGYMECVHFDIDIQYEVSIRIGWLRLLSINSITRQKWLRLCADGSMTWG